MDLVTPQPKIEIGSRVIREKNNEKDILKT